MVARAAKPATYEDLLAVPSSQLAELIDGELFTQPRPAALHQLVVSTLSGELEPKFRRGRGGPGGWVILSEPEVHLSADVLVPDLAGWRRERMPEIPDAPHLSLTPDWICEVLSPSTRAHDRGRKLRVYQREGVEWVWLVDPEAKTLEVLRLDGPSYRVLSVHEGDAPVSAEPFEAVELELGALWQR